MTSPIPTTLITAAIAGDGAALVTLLTLSQPDIRRYAQRTCRMSDVDDAAQETLLLLARRVGTLRAATSFAAWLIAIVRRECLRLARRALSAEALDDHADRLITARPDEELRLDIAAAIHSLPEHYRAVIVMRDIEERTVGEIAAALDLTREAAKARLRRARELVREYLVR